MVRRSGGCSSGETQQSVPLVDAQDTRVARLPPRPDAVEQLVVDHDRDSHARYMIRRRSRSVEDETNEACELQEREGVVGAVDRVAAHGTQHPVEYRHAIVNRAPRTPSPRAETAPDRSVGAHPVPQPREALPRIPRARRTRCVPDRAGRSRRPTPTAVGSSAARIQPPDAGGSSEAIPMTSCHSGASTPARPRSRPGGSSRLRA